MKISVINPEHLESPYVHAIDNTAYIAKEDILMHADNANVLSDVMGLNHVAVRVYSRHWHIVQCSGYNPQDGMFVHCFEN